MKLKQKGFTLIELLVVIAIIGLLASVIMLSLGSARAKARDAKRVADVRELVGALELYFNKNNTYPPDLNTLVTDSDIGSVAAAPIPQDGSCTVAQNTYTYSLVSASSFTLSFCLGAATGSYAAGVHTASQSGIN